MSRLLNIRTDLSDYKAPQYGYDRRGAGPRDTNASGQPYELRGIPRRTFTQADFGSTSPKPNEDFLLRGGQLLPETVVRDVSRLTKMFFDLKSPNGLLFTAKQEALSRTGVNILAVSNSSLEAKNRRALNNGVYLPSSTLLQAAANPLGGHLLKQGINPFANTTTGNDFDPLRNPTYVETVASQERQNANNGGEVLSRLFQFYERNILSDKNGTELYNYSGGPGSVVGIGRTNITMLNDQRTGRNNKNLIALKFFKTGTTPDTNFGFDYSVFKGGPGNTSNYVFRGGTYFGDETRNVRKSVSLIYQSLSPTTVNLFGDDGTFKTNNNDLSATEISKVGQSVYQTSADGTNGFKPNTANVKGLGTTLTYKETMDSGTVNTVTDNNEYTQVQDVQDFRQKRTNNKGVSSLDYETASNRIEQRVNLGNPGRKKATKSYVTGNNEALDKINALPLYKSEHVDLKKPINDFCKFRIGVIDNDNPSLKTYIHFRAFLENMSDEYNASWDSQEFAGRGEKLYNYAGFDRSFSLSWKVVAQSKQELIPMYQKLNYLASVCAPDYSKSGYMRGNLIELTVGAYLYKQVGIMQGINYTIPMESPWEIAIPDDDNLTTGAGDLLSDPTVKELPFMIDVSGFDFIPIHNFVPQLQNNTFGTINQQNTVGDLKTLGSQRYIALATGTTDSAANNNYQPTDIPSKNKRKTGSTNQVDKISQVG